MPMSLPSLFATLTKASHSSNFGPRNVSVVMDAARETWNRGPMPITIRSTAAADVSNNRRTELCNGSTSVTPFLLWPYKLHGRARPVQPSLASSRGLDRSWRTAHRHPRGEQDGQCPDPHDPRSGKH